MNGADLPSRNAKLHALTPDQALALDLPIGSSVRAIAGVTWLTQEGRAEDFVLAPGEAFHVATRGRIVVNGLRAPALVLAELAPGAPSSVAAVGPECIAAIEAEARRVRGREIARFAVQLAKAVARAVRRVGRVVRRSVNMLSMRQLGASVGVPADHNRRHTPRLRSGAVGSCCEG